MTARVVHIPNSTSALEAILDNSNYDRLIEELKLILLNTNYHNKSVTDALKMVRMKDQTRHTPIVILSSSSFNSSVHDSYLRGANSYIIKPVEAGTYIDTISQLAYYWSNVNQGRVW